MKVSTRGSIRKAPNAISWVYSIYNLNQSTSVKFLDSAALIKAWNLGFNINTFFFLIKNLGRCSYFITKQLAWPKLTIPLPFPCARNTEAAKQDKLVGSKHQAVKTLLELPEACRDEILKVVSQYGWDGFWNFISNKRFPLQALIAIWSLMSRIQNLIFQPFLSNIWLSSPGCPFSDDSLSSKKIGPGWNFKSPKTPKSSPWQSRLKTTEYSSILMLQIVSSQWAATKPAIRRKLTRSQLEEKAMVASLACPLTNLVSYDYEVGISNILQNPKWWFWGWQNTFENPA